MGWRELHGPFSQVMAREGGPGMELGGGAGGEKRISIPLRPLRLPSLPSCQVEDLERVEGISGKQMESFLKVSPPLGPLLFPACALPPALTLLSPSLLCCRRTSWVSPRASAEAPPDRQLLSCFLFF